MINMVDTDYTEVKNTPSSKQMNWLRYNNTFYIFPIRCVTSIDPYLSD